ncbi:MAG TPA: hypothetical protein VMF66_13680 [Candidatus Acidoferrum sp.]|nr:hypothetical protein [Candidatus Acidoferrum sp.]
MNDWAELDRALSEIARFDAVEVREDGQWLAGFSALNYELRRSGKTVLVHLWSSERNLTRRILRVREQSPLRIVLEVQRFGRPNGARLEFVRTDSHRAEARISREEFRARFNRFLVERFPDATIDSLTAAPDLEHSFSGVYVRGRMHEGPREHAVIAVCSSETPAAIEGILTFGILWLDRTRAHVQRRPVEGLRVFVPTGASRFIRERALGVASNARLEIFEFDEREGQICQMDPADLGNLKSRMMPRADAQFLLEAAQKGVEGIRELAPQNSELARSITTRVLAGAREVAISYRGLAFAHWSPEGLMFGVGETREPLTERSRPRIIRLLRDLDHYRSPLSQQTGQPLFREAPERWLETLILEDPTRIDGRLDSRFFYSSVPAIAAGDRGVLDILGITLQGRLVVIELKASEDIQMPIQAVDYWLRVRRHQLSGDFQQYGYFVGREITIEPPLVWLVAPALRFHPATETILKYLSLEIAITRIGVCENWRRGVRVVLRQ